MINIKTFRLNPFLENTYIAWADDGDAVIVDPGAYNQHEVDDLCEYIKENNIKPKGILLTHGHFDHIYGVKNLSEIYGLRVYMNDRDKAIIELNDEVAKTFGLKKPDASFETTNTDDGDVLSFGSLRFEVISTPGHTPGGVCYYERDGKVIFTGDTILSGCIGRSDFPLGDYDKLIVSVMDKVMGLDGDVDILSGHGPATNIGYERTHNPFLQPFNEPEEENIFGKDE